MTTPTPIRKQMGIVADIAARWWADRLFDGVGLNVTGTNLREAGTPTKEQCELFFDILYGRIENELLGGPVLLRTRTSKVIMESIAEAGLVEDLLPQVAMMDVAVEYVVVDEVVLYGVAPVRVQEDLLSQYMTYNPSHDIVDALSYTNNWGNTSIGIGTYSSIFRSISVSRDPRR